MPSGGNRYDDELATGLRGLGVDVREYAVVGSWPVVDEAEQRGFAERLTTERAWLVDNILAAGAPQAIAAARATGRRVAVLVHYFPADEIGWTAAERDRITTAEGAALTAASAIVTTSRWTAAQVEDRYGRSGGAVAVPGVHPAPRAPGSATGRPPRLLWLGRITRTKDPLTLIDALTRIGDLDWTARVIGPDAIDPRYTRRLRAAVQQASLADRIELTGARTGSDLRGGVGCRRPAGADLPVEPYGMVVTEALARGIPSIVSAGTGAVEAQRVGATFRPVTRRPWPSCYAAG